MHEYAIWTRFDEIMIFSTNSDDDATAQYSLHKAVAEVIEQRTK